MCSQISTCVTFTTTLKSRQENHEPTWSSLQKKKKNPRQSSTLDTAYIKHYKPMPKY